MYWSVPGFINMRGIERTFNDYLVHSITGDIWSCKSGRHLKPTRSKDTDYMQTGMMDDNGKVYSQNHQRIVLAAKLGHWDFYDAHHMNRIEQDNRPCNLEPRTRKENIDEITRQRMSEARRGEKHYSTSFTNQEVYEIKLGAIIADDLHEYKLEMAEIYDCHPATIYSMLNGKSWNHIEV